MYIFIAEATKTDVAFSWVVRPISISWQLLPSTA